MKNFKKTKMLALFVLALGFSLTSWSQVAVSEAEAIGFVRHTIYADPDGTGASSVYPVDINNDGNIDILGITLFDGIYWYENDGSENFTGHFIDTTNKDRSVYAADVDSDGDIDILVASENDDNISWYENDGSENFTEYAVDASFDQARSVYATDVDGDGNMDILGAGYNDDGVSWYENDGSENFTEYAVDAHLSGSNFVHSADMDSDGDMDILESVYYFSRNDDIVWWKNDGSENFTKNIVDNSLIRASSVYAADVDSDGNMDILGAGYGGDDIYWYENDGNENFTRHTLDMFSKGASSIYAADVDSDGDMDILGTTVGVGAYWHENDGSENFTRHSIDPFFNNGSFIYAADVDSDGDMDILGSAYSDDGFVWYENDLIDSASPILITEAKDENGVLISDGGTVLLDDTDTITINSNASDASGISNHKIRWWHYDSGGTPISAGSDMWYTGGTHSITIPGPLNDGDRIEYMSEATDTIPNPTTYDPACASCGVRYSFTVVDTNTWAKAYGDSEFDIAFSVQQTSSDGYITAGWTKSYGAGEEDALIVKLNSDGSQDWAKTFGGGDDDLIIPIQQTSDGGYITTGSTRSYGAGEEDALIVKLNSDGSQDWAKTFGGGDEDLISSIQQTSDGGYITTGSTRSYGAGNEDALIIKLNSDGSQDWAKTFGGSDDDLIIPVQQTSDGGYVIVGATKSYGAGNYSALIIKLNSDGSQDWAKTFGDGDNDYLWSVQQTSDGGYITTGSTRSYGAGNEDALIIKLNSDGSQDWAKTFGGSDDDLIIPVQQTSDGGYVIVGATKSYGAGNYSALIIKLNSDGSQDWAKTFGDGDNDYLWSVQQTSDGGYITTGSTRSYGAGNEDALIIKLNSDGSQDWARTFGDGDNDYLWSVQQTSDGGYVMAGETKSYGVGNREVLVIKLDKNGNVKDCSPPLIVLNADNPANGSACDVDTLCSEDVTATLSTTDIPKDILNPGCTVGSLCSESISEDSLDPGCTASSLCMENIAKDSNNSAVCAPPTSLCMEDITLTETDACTNDTTFPTLITEVWTPDIGTGTKIIDGGIINLSNIDEAGESVTIYSNAFDNSGIIADQKIRWWRYNSGGTLVANGNGFWDTTTAPVAGGLNFITITGPLNDGDKIEYSSEATDGAANTICDPDDPASCGIAPFPKRYSFMVKSLSVDLSVNPSLGIAPLNNVDLFADIEGTATGNVDYIFDCDITDGVTDHVYTGAADYTIADICDYAVVGTYTAKVEVVREGLTASDIVTIAVTAPNDAPTVTPYAPTIPANWCNSSPGEILLSWEFKDTEDGNGNQTEYQIDLRKGAASCSSGRQISGDTSVKAVNIPNCGGFVGYDDPIVNYDWDITVWDSAGASATATPFTIPPATPTISFSTTKHQWPTVCMTYLPVTPEQFDIVTFDPSCSVVYDGNVVNSNTYLIWDWDYDSTDATEPSKDQIFNDPADMAGTVYPPAPPVSPQVFHSFVEERDAMNPYVINLKVTDSIGYGCWASDQGAEKFVSTAENMPEWNETTP